MVRLGAIVGLALACCAACRTRPLDDLQAPPPEGRSTIAGGALRPELFEDRVEIGQRSLYLVDPGFQVGPTGRSRPEVVDTRSTLRLSFSPTGGSSEGDPASESVPDFGAAARAIEDLTGRLADQEGELASALALADREAAARAVRELAEATRGFSQSGQPNVQRRALAQARLVEASARERVIVEAFRITGRMQTALALPSYNDIGAGQVENRPRPAAVFAEDTVRDFSRKLVVAHERLEQRVDVLRSRADVLAQQIVGHERALCAEVVDYRAALTDLLAGLSPPEGTSVAIPRALNDLPPTEIDLPAHEFKRGETIKIKVSTVRAVGDEAGTIPVDAERDLVASWVADIQRIGWHRSDSLFGMLSRGTAGGTDSTNWELSFAGGVTWSWYQDNREPLGAVYSWFQPGFGLHLASLDQDVDDDVEIGIGAHVALWEGLVIVGFGANMTIDDPDRTYYMIGGDLIGWSEKVFGTLK